MLNLEEVLKNIGTVAGIGVLAGAYMASDSNINSEYMLDLISTFPLFVLCFGGIGRGAGYVIAKTVEKVIDYTEK